MAKGIVLEGKGKVKVIMHPNVSPHTNQGSDGPIPDVTEEAETYQSRTHRHTHQQAAQEPQSIARQMAKQVFKFRRVMASKHSFFIHTKKTEEAIQRAQPVSPSHFTYPLYILPDTKEAGSSEIAVLQWKVCWIWGYV